MSDLTRYVYPLDTLYIFHAYVQHMPGVAAGVLFQLCMLSMWFTRVTSDLAVGNA